MMNASIEIRRGDEIDEQALLTYLSNIQKVNIDSLKITQFPGGYSNLTYLLQINEDINWVLRKPPKGANIKSGNDMAREYKIITALKPIFGKVPSPILYYGDSEILGSEFYIMEKVDGWILRSEMSVNDLPSESDMKNIFAEFVDGFNLLHQFDYKNAGLSDLGRPENYIERQIDGWTQRYYKSKTDEIPSVEKLAKWLEAHQPIMSGAALIHNDFKYDNLILSTSNNSINAILDWEMSTLGDPLMDLGSSLGYWVNADDPDWLQKIKLSPTTLPGNPSREDLLQAYAIKSKLDPSNGVFYYAYGMLKLAVIAQQIYTRFKLGYTKDPRFAELIKVVNACGTMGLQAISAKRLDRLF